MTIHLKNPTSSTNLSDITSQWSIHIYHIWLCQEVSCSATNVPGTIAIKGVHHWIRKGWRNGRLRLAKVSSASSMESNIIVYVKNSRNVDRNKNHSTCSSCFLFTLNIKIRKKTTTHRSYLQLHGFPFSEGPVNSCDAWEYEDTTWYNYLISRGDEEIEVVQLHHPF